MHATACFSQLLLSARIVASGTGLASLYALALSAAFYGPLQGPEIAVCKALHRELTARFGHEWYDNRLTIRPNSCGNVNGLVQSA